jgi:hypothetical protein
MPKQIVRGTYSNDIVWKVPTGIDLTDKDTYTFADKWGILYIKNNKTGEEWEIEEYEQTEHDHKRAENLHISEAEDDDDEETAAQHS